ncbi:MAG TPA: phosphoribosylanthranilate isomerase [Gemmataceae bacterium]|jgi:phosphoribosylanthranilate isomerase|nr:phosphoribosylanthranilate isomerase [Gemmataceae bacterium]
MTYLRVKICGITSEADGQLAAQLGADAIGLNFYPPSPRHVEPAAAARILRALPPFVEAVGLFINQPLRQVCQTLQPLGRIRVIQWYGEQRELSDPYPFQLIPAFNVRDANSLLEITRYLDLCRGLGRLPAAILADASVPGQYGGTGRTAPWNLLADFRPEVPLILAGGLTPENVAEAVRIVRPYAVDVASGVESAPGRKDPEKMRRFIASAREAAARLAD